MPISSALGSSALLPAGLGFRNLIINGGMQVAQRGTTFTFASGAGSLYYGADRFRTQDYTWSAGTSPTVSNDANVYPPGFSNSYKVATGAVGLTIASGGTFFVETSVEGYTAASTYGKMACLSFWVRSSVVGTYNVLLENNTWWSGTTTRIYTPEYTINVANTWEYKTILINFGTATASGTWNRTNGKGIGVSFILGANADRTGDIYKNDWTTFSSFAGIKTSSSVNWASNANATFYITGVQLEQNYQPTPFEQRPYGTELALCQRYYETGTAWLRNQNNDTLRSSFDAVYYKQTKRSSTVTVTSSFANNTNVGACSMVTNDDSSGYISWTASSGTDFQAKVSWTAASEL